MAIIAASHWHPNLYAALLAIAIILSLYAIPGIFGAWRDVRRDEKAMRAYNRQRRAAQRATRSSH